MRVYERLRAVEYVAAVGSILWVPLALYWVLSAVLTDLALLSEGVAVEPTPKVYLGAIAHLTQALLLTAYIFGRTLPLYGGVSRTTARAKASAEP